jgi:DNA polymerase II small subunit/DNA polymerase delta subunit B
MRATGLKPGDDVITPQARGIVVDVRATPSGKWVYGVEDASGAVNYFTEKALTRASS